MDLITFGCSFTRDNYQDTWANVLSQKLGLQLDNRAERGSGSEFIVNRILTSNLENAVVAVMWPNADRLDLWADNSVPHLQNDIEHAAWLDGVQPEFVDMHGNRGQTTGFNLNGYWPRGYKEYYYKYLYTSYQSVHTLYRNIITTQLYLDSIGVKYVMMSSVALQYPLVMWKAHFEVEPEIYNKINIDKFVAGSEKEGFINWCLTNNKPFLNKWYPTTQSHAEYCEQFILPRAKHEFGNLI